MLLRPVRDQSEKLINEAVRRFFGQALESWRSQSNSLLPYVLALGQDTTRLTGASSCDMEPKR